VPRPGPHRPAIAPASESAPETPIAAVKPSLKAAARRSCRPRRRRRQDRDPRHPAELAQHAGGAGGLADRRLLRGADDRARGRRDRHRSADPGDGERRDQLAIGEAESGDQRDPGHPGGLQRKLADQQREPPEAAELGCRAGVHPAHALATGPIRSAAACDRQSPPPSVLVVSPDPEH
jgi:hypothetical protein